MTNAEIQIHIHRNEKIQITIWRQSRKKLQSQVGGLCGSGRGYTIRRLIQFL